MKRSSSRSKKAGGSDSENSAILTPSNSQESQILSQTSQASQESALLQVKFPIKSVIPTLPEMIIEPNFFFHRGRDVKAECIAARSMDPMGYIFVFSGKPKKDFILKFNERSVKKNSCPVCHHYREPKAKGDFSALLTIFAMNSHSLLLKFAETHFARHARSLRCALLLTSMTKNSLSC
jgi:hypothetical protein